MRENIQLGAEGRILALYRQFSAAQRTMIMIGRHFIARCHKLAIGFIAKLLPNSTHRSHHSSCVPISIYCTAVCAINRTSAPIITVQRHVAAPNNYHKCNYLLCCLCAFVVPSQCGRLVIRQRGFDPQVVHINRQTNYHWIRY